MNKTVLIIEDNADNYYLMQYLLNNKGYIVVWAETGKEGIIKAKQITPLVILLDIQLPEMDGYSVAEEIKRQDEIKDIPIIAVTSYAMVGDKERALASGATAYMEKPIDPETFVSEIEYYISDEYKQQGGIK